MSMRDAPQPEAVRRFVASTDMTDATNSCDADLLRGQANFWRVVSNHRRQGGSTDGLALEDRLRESTLLQQISCYPTNGIAWAELATLELTKPHAEEQAMRFLTLSQKYAPYEGEALEIRLKLLLTRRELRDGSRQSVFQRDIITAIEYGPVELAAFAIEHLDPGGRKWAESLIQRLEPPRRDALRRAAEGLAKG